MARCIGPKLVLEPRSLVAGCQGVLQRAATTATRPRLAPLLVASRAGKATDVPLAEAEPDSSPARDAPSAPTSTAPGLGSSAAESPHEHEVAAPGPASGSRGPSLSPAKASSSSPSAGAARATNGSSGPGGSPAGPGGPGGPGGSGSSPPGGGVDGLRLRYWLVLLVEYGGIYGTAAVVLSALTGVPAFGPGGVRWEAWGDVGLGLAIMAPALALDALVGLPDWSTRREEDARQLVRLFVDPEALAAERKARQSAKGSGGDKGAAAPLTSTTTTTTSAATTTAAGDATAAAVGEAARLLASAAAAAELSSAAAAEEEEAQAAGRADSGASASTSGSGSGSGKDDAAPSPLWAALQRLRMALELMQETSIRNNPGARLTPLQELAVIVVAVTADEMLYRAVLLTLVGRWLRDRFYEAGADDTLLLSLPFGGGGGGSLVELDTGTAGLWAALFLGCAAGAGVFAGKAWQEVTLANRLQAVQAAQREALEQQLKRQRLGTHMTAEEVRQRQEQQARLEALQTNFASSVGVQGALVWLLEGAREVYQVAAAGGAFILTGNLAAPLAGGLAAQCLLSAYQRLGLRRSMERRAEVMRRRKAQAKAAAKEREVHRLRQEAAAKELAARAEEEEAAAAAERSEQGQAEEGTVREGKEAQAQGSRQLEGAAAAVGPGREQQEEQAQPQPQQSGVNGHKSNEA
ncbi:hypothetical protein HYH02_010436 [Chlamydomonas schloesseri]|uniref:Uncharacterized protein n=1 Tax=Chlamydomonas schloesseri TaxID=2026947 RepID=A0A835T991_9CHLO|nr:hypothetical protein HYH02_010436 [Chlamydomonas schloesseri]|eukprot:KAG2439801.1 hypothetical protein HYH02_010436 [Chlamydomonas schloesseri]